MRRQLGRSLNPVSHGWFAPFLYKNEKTKMGKIYGLVLLLFGVVTDVCAQFSSSEAVYCYKYDYTSNDGIKSKKSSTTYYFVNFQNDMMGYTTASDIKTIRQKMLEDASYYEDAARNNLANNYSRWKSSPSGLPTIGPARASVSIYQYNDQYSTYSRYTYRRTTKWACNTGNIWDTFGQGNYWAKPSWGSSCYSFSSDRSEMIIWSTSDSENRDYYKRINMSDLKPNTDFLY